jgi:hypothetical protein
MAYQQPFMTRGPKAISRWDTFITRIEKREKLQKDNLIAQEQHLFECIEQYKTTTLFGQTIAAMRLRKAEPELLIVRQTYGLKSHVAFVSELSHALGKVPSDQLRSKWWIFRECAQDLRGEVRDYIAMRRASTAWHPLLENFNACAVLKRQLSAKLLAPELWNMLDQEIIKPPGPVTKTLGSEFKAFLTGLNSFHGLAQSTGDLYVVVLLKRSSSMDAQHIFNYRLSTKNGMKNSPANV